MNIGVNTVKRSSGLKPEKMKFENLTYFYRSLQKSFQYL